MFGYMMKIKYTNPMIFKFLFTHFLQPKIRFFLNFFSFLQYFTAKNNNPWTYALPEFDAALGGCLIPVMPAPPWALPTNFGGKLPKSW